MRKVTTTKKINEAINNHLLHIAKAEIYYKTSRKMEIVDTDRLQENFSFLCESGIFMDAIGWHFEQDCKTGLYITECGRMNPDTEVIISVYLDVCEGVKGEDINMVLNVEEEE